MLFRLPSKHKKEVKKNFLYLSKELFFDIAHVFIHFFKHPRKTLQIIYKKTKKMIKWCFSTLTRKVVSTIVIFSLLISPFAFILFTPKAQASWWDETWSYRKAMSITNASGTDLTDFQVKILENRDVSADITAGKIQSDLDDIRFTDQSGKLLPYWIEDSTATSVDVWVKAPSISTSGATIFWYYGNSTASNAQNGDAVFEFFDDFNGISLNIEKWTETDTGGYISQSGGEISMSNGPANWGNTAVFSNRTFSRDNLEFNYKFRPTCTTGSSYHETTMFGWKDSGNGMSYTDMPYAQYWYKTVLGSPNLGVYEDGSNKGWNGTFICNTQYYGKIKLKLSGGAVYMTSTDGMNWNQNYDSVYSIENNLKIGFTHYQGGVGYVDDIFVKKYASTEPVTTLSSTEEKSPAPVGYWKFDEGSGTTAQDASGKNNTGTLTNMSATPSPTSGWQTEDKCISGKCLAFDGTDDLIAISDDDLGTSVENFSISVWVKAINSPTSDGWGYLVHRGSSISLGASVYALGINSSGNYFGSVNGRYTEGSTNVPASLDAWTFLSLVYESGEQRIYVNGKLNSSYTLGVITNTQTSNQISIGGTSWNISYRHVKGFIDEPKIYPYARTADQIKQDYTSGLAGMGTNQGSSVTFGDNSDKWMSDGLVGHWKMDEVLWNGTSGEVKDISGNNNNGTAVNGATTGGGKFGNGGNFDGSNDYVSTNVTGARSSIISVSTWIKPNSTMTTRQDFIESGSSATYATNNWIFSVKGNTGSTAGLSVLGYSSSGSSNLSTVGGVLTQNIWNHVVFTSDGSMVKIYVNGVLSISGSITINGNNATGEFIGSGSGGTNPFNGSIDETRIYNRALNAEEVRKLYQYAPGPVGHWKMDEGSGITASDSSGNGNTGTLTNGPTWDTGKVGKALSFDGVDDYVNTGTLSTTSYSQFTMCSWVKLNANPSTWSQIIGDSGGMTAFIQVNTSGQIQSATNFGSGNIRGSFVSLGSNWNHVCMTWASGLGVSLYKNGILNDTTAVQTGAITLSSLWMARYSHGTYLNANIDDVRIYNYARTQDQILEDMSARGGSTSGGNANSALAYYKLDEGNSTTANNSGIGGSTLNGTLTNMDAPATSTSGWTNDGKIGKGLNFDGTNDHVLSGQKVFSGDTTVSAWFKPRSFTSNWAGVGTFQYKSGTSGTGWQITPLATGVKVVVGRTGSNYITQTFSATLPINSWSHILATHSNGVFRVYLNGKKIGSDWSQPVVYDAIGDKVHIGRWAWDYNGYYFEGLIDETKIYNFSLTEDEIKAEYNRGSAITQGTAKPVTVGGPATGAHEKYCPPGNIEGNCASGLDPTPVGEWTFDDGTGTTIKDTSGKNNNGTLTNGPIWDVGKVGKAVKFDGTNDYSTSTVNGLNISGDASVSLSAWFKTDSISSAQSIAVFGDTVALHNFSLMINNNGNGSVSAEFNGGIGYRSSSGLINPNQWYHLEAVKIPGAINTTTKLYLNGKEIIANSVSSSIPAINISLNYFGQWSNGGYYFTGSIDDVRIYNYARTPAQIAWEYNRGKPIAHYKMDECEGSTIHDASGNNNHGTWNGSAGGTQMSAGTCQTANTAWGNGVNGKFNSSLNFDGVDDYVDTNVVIDQPTATGNTYSAWIKTSDALNKAIVGNSSSTSYSLYNCGGIQLNEYNQPFMVVYNGSTYKIATGSFSVANAKWHHIVGLFNPSSGNISLYVNGKLEEEISVGGNLLCSSSLGAQIGKRHKNTDPAYFSGQIDDVQIFNYALSDEQIKLLYNGGASLRFGE